MKLKEHLSGIGYIFDNNENLGDVNYQLYVYQEIVEGEDGLKSIEGNIDSTSAMKFFSKENLVLTIEDGRSIKFFVRNSNGEIRCSGGFFQMEVEY